MLSKLYSVPHLGLFRPKNNRRRAIRPRCSSSVSKLSLTDVSSGYVSVAALNANFDAIEEALENTLSRDGTSPNTMSANLDMNSQRILNLAAPSGANDAARLRDISDSDATGAASAQLRSDLASTSSAVLGDDLVGVKRTATSAVAITMHTWIEGQVLNAKTDFGAVGNGVADDTAELQAALVAAAGKALYLPTGTYLVTGALSFPSNTTIFGDGASSVIYSNVNPVVSTSGKTNIRLKGLKFDTTGSLSMVIDFDNCTNLVFEDVIYDGLQGSNLSSIAFRMFGCRNVTFNRCQIYDVDSGVYLDYNNAGAGATACDDIRVLNSLFEQTVTGTSNNPTGVYQYNCKNLLVDGCTFRGIRAGGGAPIAGYSVYEGDGTATSLVVTNCLTVMTTSHPHVMVQNSNAPTCVVKNNRFYAIGPNYPSGTYFNWLYNGTPPLGSVNISDNFVDQAGISLQGAGSVATAVRSVIVHHNHLQNLTQSLGGAIRIGNIGTTYVHHAQVTQNSIYKTYSAAIQISEAAYAVVEDNYCANWNRGNNVTNTPPYSMAIYFEGVGANSSVGTCRRNRLENNTQVGADTGYPVDGIVVQNATNLVVVEDNSIDSAVTVPYLRCIPAFESGTWTPSVGGTATYTGQTGLWSRRGKLVTIHFDLTINAIGTGSANVISGLPASISTIYASGLAIGIFTGGAVSVVHLGGYVSGTSVQLVGATAAASAFTSVGPMGNGTHITGTTTYMLP